VDTRAFIESGILESYILGNCTTEERQQVECMARIFPDVHKELEAVQKSFEQFILSNKVDPPSHVKARIVEAIEKEEQLSARQTEARVIPINTKLSSGKKSGSALLIAASVAIIIISGIMLYNLNEKNERLSAQLNQLQDEQQENKAKYEQLAQRFENVNRHLVVLTDPHELKVTMKGTALSPQSVASVFWNQNSKEVFLAAQSLPEPPAGKQYQLWGIVNGTPVDLGVFDVSKTSEFLIQQMKKVEGATTFAVTLEKAGGSPVPTLDQMYAAGNI